MTRRRIWGLFIGFEVALAAVGLLAWSASSSGRMSPIESPGSTSGSAISTSSSPIESPSTTAEVALIDPPVPPAHTIPPDRLTH